MIFLNQEDFDFLRETGKNAEFLYLMKKKKNLWSQNSLLVQVLIIKEGRILYPTLLEQGFDHDDGDN